uniref:cell wall-binding repeat-containing protein n=1 Tax=Agromyces subbeticus TaxID=293890 RepID=UPI00047D0727
AESYAPGVDVVFVANGLNFPDALAGAPVAGAQGGPLLLVADSMIPAVVAAELDRLDPKRIVVLGGAGVVHESVVQELADFID